MRRRFEPGLPRFHAHVVFTIKYRRGALTDPILTRCEQIMADVCRDFGAELRGFSGETEHVHLLVHYPPAVALSKLGASKGGKARAASLSAAKRSAIARKAVLARWRKPR